MRFKKILILFLSWRAVLFLTAFFATLLIPFKSSFPYYDSELISTHLPEWIWGFGNFDGVHYLRIARNLYSSDFTQAFFPLYPLAVKFLTWGNNFFITGLILSNLLTLGFLGAFYKLLEIDYSEKISWRTLIFTLAFPTAFFLGAVYSESLFLILVVVSLIFLRREKFLLSGFFAALASAARVFGFILFPILLLELYLSFKREKKISLSNILGVLIAPLGGILYMIYLKINFNDALYFLNSQPHFGASRSASLVTLPQVIYRYIKIFLTVPVGSEQYITAALELLFTVLFAGLLVYSFKKVRWSYWLFSLGCFILPTLTGTLSSMPRYSLCGFLLFPALLERLGKNYKLAIIILAVFELVLTGLYVRGYFIA
jgi:Gpi18-like mannosyltransferase